MADGRLNKCAACVVKDVSEWRKTRPPGHRHKEYLKAIESGKRTPKYKWGVRNPILKVISGLKYMHKRRLRGQSMTDFDEFVFSEAIRLRDLRKSATGFQWSLDHVVPLNHKYASGLHNAFNFQVVPLDWNIKKNNGNMNAYWPVGY